MNNNLKNIPNQFLKNTNIPKNLNDDVFISSIKLQNELDKKNDNIWFIIVLLIIFDII